MSPDTETVQNALRRVIDPEVGINIVDLGLVYALDWTDRGLQVDITMTSPACPMGEGILAEVEAVLNEALPPSTHRAVNLVWEPPWSPERMSERARTIFGWAP